MCLPSFFPYHQLSYLRNSHTGPMNRINFVTCHFCCVPCHSHQTNLIPTYLPPVLAVASLAPSLEGKSFAGLQSVYPDTQTNIPSTSHATSSDILLSLPPTSNTEMEHPPSLHPSLCWPLQRQELQWHLGHDCVLLGSRLMSAVQQILQPKQCAITWNDGRACLQYKKCCCPCSPIGAWECQSDDWSLH